MSEIQITAKSQGSAVNIYKMDDKNRSKFEQWKSEIFSLRDHPLILHLANDPWEKYYQNCLRAFQKGAIKSNT